MLTLPISQQPKVEVVGQPDRIDLHPDGYFVMDYKSGGQLPNGSEILEQGYRLQLGFYALAAKHGIPRQAQSKWRAEAERGKSASSPPLAIPDPAMVDPASTHHEPEFLDKRDVIGAQFIQLNSSASRSNGIFFTQWNGKKKGSLTAARSNSKSLVALEPMEAWGKLEDQMRRRVLAYVGGEFEASPLRGERECKTCHLTDLCGYRRRLGEVRADSESGSGGSEEEGSSE